MRLIGMLDSPYVRRVAISMECQGVPFEHEAVSVFSTFEKFQRINPIVKARRLALVSEQPVAGKSFKPTRALSRVLCIHGRLGRLLHSRPIRRRDEVRKP